MRCHRSLRAAACAVALVISPSASAEIDKDYGREIAENMCAGCHAVGRIDESRNPNAPAFRTLSERYPLEYLEEALAEGIVVGHGGLEMPAYAFNPDEIASLIEYMKSISN